MEKIRGPLEEILGAPLLYPIPPGPALPYTALPLLSGSADHLRSFPAPSGNDRPFMTHPGPVQRCPALLGNSRPCFATCLALSGPVLPFPSLPGSVWRCLALSVPARPVLIILVVIMCAQCLVQTQTVQFCAAERQ